MKLLDSFCQTFAHKVSIAPHYNFLLVLIVHKVLGVLILVLQMCHNVKPASMVNIVLEMVLFLTTKALNVILFTIALYRTLQILLELFWVLLKE